MKLTQSSEPIAQFDAPSGRFVARPIDLGPETDQVFLILFGTGIRGGTTISTAANVGGFNAPVEYAGAQGSFTGLDQINLRLPRTLAGRGEVDVLITVKGKPANPVKVRIR